MVPFGFPTIIIRHPLSRVPKRDHNFDNTHIRNPNKGPRFLNQVPTLQARMSMVYNTEAVEPRAFSTDSAPTCSRRDIIYFLVPYFGFYNIIISLKR